MGNKNRERYRTVTTCPNCGSEDVWLDALVNCNTGEIRDEGNFWCDECENSTDPVVHEELIGGQK